jgi:nucleotide-binding universal stress UspA family protein
MRKILFPFEEDKSLYREAYIHAVKFARKINAELILLNVFQVEVGNDITEEKYARLKRDNWFKAYNEISWLNKYYLEDHANVETDLQIRFDYRFVNGILVDEIKKIAMEEEVDLMVMPISDKREFNKRQMKIMRDNVFEKNRTSLLLVPSSLQFRPLRNIVVAIDLKKLFNYQLYLNDIITYASLFDASIHFIHVSSRDKKEEW